MDMRSWKPLALTLGISAASISYANADVDIDNDGLIEISTLEQLDLMRYDLAGTSLNGDSTGCPLTGCNGYELVADLDFDTNGNGIADEGDQFWNGGEGWSPVGDTTYYQSVATWQVDDGAFTASFDGNNFEIENIFINRPDENWVGLFRNNSFGNVKNLTFRGGSVSGRDGVGTLTGSINDMSVSNLRVVDVSVDGVNQVGGLSGRLFGIDGNIASVNIDASVNGNIYVGGMVGFAKGNRRRNIDATAVISNSIVDVVMNTGRNSGGVVGRAETTSLSQVISKGRITSGVYNTGTSEIGGIAGSTYFSKVSDAVSSMTVEGSVRTGGIVGTASRSELKKVAFVEGGVVGGSAYAIVGGIVGVLLEGSLQDAYVSGELKGRGLSGAVSEARFIVSISNVIAYPTMNLLNASGAKYGLVGSASYSNTEILMEGSYWDSDITGTTATANNVGSPVQTEELQCPTMPGDAMCDASLYADWDETIWDFGTSSDYPVLR